jgi:hypothetical protein
MENNKDKNLFEKWNSKKTKTELKKVFNSNKNKDENKPTKCSSSYILFCKDKRNEVKNKYPDLSAKQIVGKLAELWKELKASDSKDIKKYQDLYIKDKERYLSEKIEYENYLNDKKKIDDVTSEVSEPKPKKTRKKKEVLENIEELENLKHDVDERKNYKEKEYKTRDDDRSRDYDSDYSDRSCEKSRYYKRSYDRDRSPSSSDKKVKKTVSIYDGEEYIKFFQKKEKKIKKLCPDLTDDEVTYKVNKKWKKFLKEEDRL